MSFIRKSTPLLFRAGSALRAGAPNRADVDLAMSKWWKAYKKQDGMGKSDAPCCFWEPRVILGLYKYHM